MKSWPAGELEPEPEYNVHFSSEEGLTGGVRHSGLGAVGPQGGVAVGRGGHSQEQMGRNTGIQRSWVSNCSVCVFLYFSVRGKIRPISQGCCKDHM